VTPEGVLSIGSFSQHAQRITEKIKNQKRFLDDLCASPLDFSN